LKKVISVNLDPSQVPPAIQGDIETLKKVVRAPNIAEPGNLKEQPVVTTSTGTGSGFTMSFGSSGGYSSLFGNSGGILSGISTKRIPITSTVTSATSLMSFTAAKGTAELPSITPIPAGAGGIGVFSGSTGLFGQRVTTHTFPSSTQIPQTTTSLFDDAANQAVSTSQTEITNLFNFQSPTNSGPGFRNFQSQTQTPITMDNSEEEAEVNVNEFLELSYNHEERVPEDTDKCKYFLRTFLRFFIFKIFLD
jgi:hypothetical protein